MVKRRSVVALVTAAAILALGACVPDPPPPPTVVPPELEPGTCFDGVTSGAYDLLYLGPDIGVPNAQTLQSTDGSCSGTPFYAVTVVFSDPGDASAADALCEARGEGFGPAALAPPGAYTPNPPARMWLCTGSAQLPIGDPPAVGTCWAVPGADAKLVAEFGQVDNLAVSISNSESPCTNDTVQSLTVVWAATPSSAAAACLALDPGSVASGLWGLPGSPFPIGMWQCTQAPPPPP